MTKLYANFYDIDLDNSIEGRSHLDIITDSRKNTIDLLFIMLNPGGCSIKNGEVDPDPTLKRIISVLNASSKFKNCRVINLSDVREADSKKFFKNCHTYLNDYSIFSDSRKHDLEKLITPNMKAIIAWGKKIQNSKYSKSAIIKIKSMRVKIINENLPHYHPLIRLKGYSWSNEISDILRQYS